MQQTRPLHEGQKLGEVIYSFGGKEIGRSELVAVDAVKKASLSDTIKKLPKIWFRRQEFDNNGETTLKQ